MNVMPPTQYTLHRSAHGGWILVEGDSSIIMHPNKARVFESVKSLVAKLPSIIDPEAAKQLLESLPKRGKGGKFLSRVNGNPAFPLANLVQGA